MKLLILSDSHRKMDYMYQAVEREKPDRIIHLGDHERDAMRLAERYPGIPLWSVSGNCDHGAGPERIVDVLEGVRFFVTHGHTLRVKYGLLRAELYVGMSIIRLPYPMLISVIIGVTNIIPFFGPLIGAIPSALLILLINPFQCFIFVIFILLLQQFDGNILGPRILGDSVGESSVA